VQRRRLAYDPAMMPAPTDPTDPTDPIAPIDPLPAPSDPIAQVAPPFDPDIFRTESLAAGFDVVLERIWAPDTVIDTHTHPFAVRAVVTQGELWLTCGGETRHLTAGCRFELPHSEPHAERYGPAGATFWVARRTAA
jgi:AraC-like ligand binding domain